MLYQERLHRALRGALCHMIEGKWRLAKWVAPLTTIVLKTTIKGRTDFPKIPRFDSWTYKPASMSCST